MSGSVQIPHDPVAERQLETLIVSLMNRLHETIEQLAEARAELALRRKISSGEIPQSLRPIKPRSIAELVIIVLKKHLHGGRKFGELKDEIQRTGRKVEAKSLTAVLGRLKRERKIARHRGCWKIVSIANGTFEPEDEPREREFEKRDDID